MTQEAPAPSVASSKYVMGVDLGRVEPFTLVVVHESSGSRVAQFAVSPRLRVLTGKRDRLNEELGHLRDKSRAYANLSLPANPVLEQERVRTRAKRNRLLNKITWLIATEIDHVAQKYSPRYVALEDLSWVTASKGMSRWTHGRDQTSITHKLTRSGFSTKKVNPKNSSNECHKCGERVIHKTGKRLIVCSACSMSLDRDINAAIIIACRPLPKRSKGSNCTVNTEVTAMNPTKRLITSITRNTS